jgi:hypothetical protein
VRRKTFAVIIGLLLVAPSRLQPRIFHLLIDFVADTIRSILLEDADVISRLAATRKRCENWLQIEVFKQFIRQFPEIETVLERAYPSGGQERCDLWCRDVYGHENWVELKTCVTNYEQKYGPSSARPITTQISDVIRDVERLARLPLESKRHLFLLVYPMPDSGIPPQPWCGHLGRLRDSGGSVEQVFTTPVCVASQKASVVGYTIAI